MRTKMYAVTKFNTYYMHHVVFKLKMLAAIYAVVISSLLSLRPCSCLQQSKGSCPLWHILRENGKCECGETFDGLITCDKKFVYIIQGNCLTWNNSTSRADVNSCLFSTLWDPKHICVNNMTLCHISINISGIY